MTDSAESRPVTIKPNSRRALLAGALGGIGAWAASVIGRASPAQAANGDPIYIGANNYGTSETRLGNTAPSAVAFRADSGSGNGFGVIGTADNGYGVYGSASTGRGVYGTSTNYRGVEGTTTTGIGMYGSSGSGEGILGTSDAANLSAIRGYSGGNSTGLLGTSGTPNPGAKPKTGVYGYAVQDAGSRGVWGYSRQGQGVRGQAANGVGVYGRAWATGHALFIHGRFKAEQISGVASIPAGSTGVTIDPGVKVNAGSFVLLTPKANLGSRGLWFTTNPSANTFRIRMSSTRSANTQVAWLLLG